MVARPKVLVSVAEKWRLTLDEAAALVGVSDSYLRELVRKGEFPPRVHVGSEHEGKNQFIAAEVRAWAEGRNWRAMVMARKEVADAS